jgi:invasion protein IalB
LDCRLEYGKRAAPEVARERRRRVILSPEDWSKSKRVGMRRWTRFLARRSAVISFGLKGHWMSFDVTRLGAAALALSLALGGGSALAQNAPAKPAAPAPAPAAPGQAAPGQGAQPAPPAKVDLVSPEPQWAKFCAKEQTTGKDACATMRDFSTSADQPPVISVNVFELQGEEKRKLRLMIAPIGLMIRPGFRVIIDKNEPLEGRYELCSTNACASEVEMPASALSSMKKGQNLALIVRVPGGDPTGRELTFNIPLKDFGTAFDGKPTDPKVLEEQRQQLQQQLQKKAEEQRKLLEQQNPAAPAGGVAAPAPNAPAAAPAAPQAKQ